MSADAGSLPPHIEFPRLVTSAWAELKDPRRIVDVIEISANVSTNHVYRVLLDDGHEVIAKTSSYGSYVHFRQDHQLIQQWIRLLGATRFATLLAEVIQRDHEVVTYRQDHCFVVFYRKAPFYDFLPKVLSDVQVAALGREIAHLHKASARAARRMNPSWKSLGSDIAALYDALGNRDWRRQRGYDDSAEHLLRQQCDAFLSNAEKLGYHHFAKIPVLVDWNIGNFSVGFDRNGFKLYSRWDYDWFRIEPRVLDFYFCARVVRSEGDQTAFSYLVDPLFDPRFGSFLRAYHSIFPLQESEVLFLKEAYRFFILNYVVRSGEHFFRPSYCARLQQEALHTYLPNLERTDFTPLLRYLS